MAEPYLIGALVMGGIIGLIELIFVHADERGLGWLSHGLHALPVAMIFTFIAMNLGYAASLAGFVLKENPLIDLGLRAVIGIVAIVKVKGAAAIVQGHNSVGEKFWHAAVIGILIAASPYIWQALVPLLPQFLTGAEAPAPTR